jgi:hypothetical protein
LVVTTVLYAAIAYLRARFSKPIKGIYQPFHSFLHSPNTRNREPQTEGEEQNAERENTERRRKQRWMYINCSKN